jgi:hypothetical protein
MVLAGLVLHIAAIFVWSAIYLWIAGALGRRVLSAVLIASGQFILSWIIASSSGSGLATVLALGDRLVVAVVLAIALVVGMRFAFPSSRGERPSAPLT